MVVRFVPLVTSLTKMSPGILYKHSVKQLVLDIDGILTKLKNVISFGANMEVNWSIILLYGSQKEYERKR